MATSPNKQAEAKLQEIEKSQGKAFMEKDVDARVLHYHPDAIMIHKGVGVYHGRNEIKKAVKPIMESKVGASKVTPTYADSSSDGQYLIRHGNFTVSGKDFPFVQIYKKHGNEYLIYHDEFKFSY